MAVLEDRSYREAQARSVGIPLDDESVNAAAEDYRVVIQFLLSYGGSTATFNSYRRELERLLQWSWLIKRASVRRLGRDDIVAFVKFTLNPPLAWIGTKNVARFVNREGQRTVNPDWRPFVVSISKAEFQAGMSPDKSAYSPSQAALRATFAVLSSFYDYLSQESLVPTNPVSLIRQKSQFLRSDHQQAPVRRISDLQWDYVLETAEIMASQDSVVHERTLFCMTALFAMYLRISELVADERSAPVMGDFRKDRDGNWWFHVTGKGNKNRTVTVSDAMLNALKRYRRSRGLSPLPAAGDTIPLIPKIRGKGPVTSTRLLRLLVQDCFDQSYQRMCEDGLTDDAEDLKTSTVHWLRHTGISEDVQTRPREHVRDDAGHASMATTDRYIESDRRERHYSGKEKPVRYFE
ncbi:MAG: site-specific integrase [Pseudomonadota bacterium]